MNELVSIIMLSKDNGRYVKETIDSVLAQTYQNWELIFLDDKSNDDTIRQMMDYIQDKRIKVSQNSQARGSVASMNSSLRDARGRWIAFLNVGDLWESTKLEKQITFMESNGYAFSYTKFALINTKSDDRGVVIGGKEHITHKDMLKCCWPGYLTVMYDTDKVGMMSVRNLRKDNDYALWLNVAEEADCYLLDECLAKQRTPWGMLGKIVLTDKFKWRYECYRIEEGFPSLKASWYTLRNGCYGIWKWIKYVKRK